VGREALRDTVLKAANELLAVEGASALTMRRIADHIGSSTTVLYNVFDGKNGIIDAMVIAGHDSLRARLEAIPESEEPFARLAATGRIYRDAALDDPARYQLMFGNAVPGYQPSRRARQAAKLSFDALAAVVQQCIDAGVLVKTADAQFVAEILTAAAHGAVSLEIAGHFGDATRADERFAVISAASVRPFLANDA
jgi:AcrR family transcriptional regulator